IDNQRMAGVVPALKAHHATGLVSQQVYNFAFAFIAPLGAEHDYTFSGGGRSGLARYFTHCIAHNFALSAQKPDFCLQLSVLRRLRLSVDGGHFPAVAIPYQLSAATEIIGLVWLATECLHHALALLAQLPDNKLQC